jgi:DNA-binding MarR family transcriptional regulator
MGQRSEDHLKAKTGALLPAATRAVIGLYRPHLAPLRLTHPQFLVLLVLEKAEPRGVVEIGEQLALSPGTMSPILKRLELLGYVGRTRDPADERRLAITLTDSGRALLPRLLEIRDHVNGIIGLSPSERQHLQRFVASMPDATQAGEDEVAEI